MTRKGSFIMKLRKLITMTLAAVMMVSTVSVSALAAEANSEFVADDLMNENSISPEEFMEKTGITYRLLNSSEAEDVVAENARNSMLRGNISRSLTFVKNVKPDFNSSTAPRINFATYFVQTMYKSVGESNMYSRELMQSPNMNTIRMAISPDDNKTSQFRAIVHIKAEYAPTGEVYETTLFEIPVGAATTGAEVNDMENYNITMYINLANSNASNVSRTGTISMNAH